MHWLLALIVPQSLAVPTYRKEIWHGRTQEICHTSIRRSTLSEQLSESVSILSLWLKTTRRHIALPLSNALSTRRMVAGQSGRFQGAIGGRLGQDGWPKVRGNSKIACSSKEVPWQDIEHSTDGSSPQEGSSCYHIILDYLGTKFWIENFQACKKYVNMSKKYIWLWVEACVIKSILGTNFRKRLLRWKWNVKRNGRVYWNACTNQNLMLSQQANLWYMVHSCIKYVFSALAK